MTTPYAVSVSDNPRIPVGTIIGMKGRARIWIGSTQKPDARIVPPRADVIGDREKGGHKVGTAPLSREQRSGPHPVKHQVGAAFLVAGIGFEPMTSGL